MNRFELSPVFDMELRGTDGMTEEERDHYRKTEPCCYCGKREEDFYGTVCPTCEKLYKKWRKLKDVSYEIIGRLNKKRIALWQGFYDKWDPFELDEETDEFAYCPKNDSEYDGGIKPLFFGDMQEINSKMATLSKEEYLDERTRVRKKYDKLTAQVTDAYIPDARNWIREQRGIK